MSFVEIADEIRLMSYDDKLTLKELLDKYLVEERRLAFLEDHHTAVGMADRGELEFTDNIGNLLDKLR
jgi:hypothetical protein